MLSQKSKVKSQKLEVNATVDAGTELVEVRQPNDSATSQKLLPIFVFSTLLALIPAPGRSATPQISCGAHLGTYVASSSLLGNRGIRCLKLGEGGKESWKANLPALAWYGEGTTHRVLGQAFWEGANLKAYASTNDGRTYPPLLIRKFPDTSYPDQMELVNLQGRILEVWQRVPSLDLPPLRTPISCGRNWQAYKISTRKLACGLKAIPPGFKFALPLANPLTTWVSFSPNTIRLGTFSSNGYGQNTICFPGKACDRMDLGWGSLKFYRYDWGLIFQNGGFREFWRKK